MYSAFKDRKLIMIIIIIIIMYCYIQCMEVMAANDRKIYYFLLYLE